jgi:hypothetical protein
VHVIWHHNCGKYESLFPMVSKDRLHHDAGEARFPQIGFSMASVEVPFHEMVECLSLGGIFRDLYLSPFVPEMIWNRIVETPGHKLGDFCHGQVRQVAA